MKKSFKHYLKKETHFLAPKVLFFGLFSELYKRIISLGKLLKDLIEEISIILLMTVFYPISFVVCLAYHYYVYVTTKD